MRTLNTSAALLCALVLAGCGADSESAQSASDPAPATSSTAPSEPAATESPAKDEPADANSRAVAETLKFTGTTVDGDAFDGATLAGKPTVLWFWAPWCPTCQGQAPNVSALAKEYDGRVNVVGVAGLSDSDDEVKAFADNTSGVTNLSDKPGEIWKRFGIVEQSVYTVLDADGKVVSEGYLTDSELNDLVAGLA
ncbi:MAG: redoxin family protein [Nocardioides sp.]